MLRVIYESEELTSWPGLLVPASDLLSGCLSYLAIVRNTVVLFEGFLSPSDHSILLSVISVDDVLVF